MEVILTEDRHDDILANVKNIRVALGKLVACSPEEKEQFNTIRANLGRIITTLEGGLKI